MTSRCINKETTVTQQKEQRRTNLMVIQSNKIAGQQAKLARLEERIGYLMSQRALGEEKLAQMILRMRTL